TGDAVSLVGPANLADFHRLRTSCFLHSTLMCSTQVFGTTVVDATGRDTRKAARVAPRGLFVFLEHFPEIPPRSGNGGSYAIFATALTAGSTLRCAARRGP